MRLRANLFVWIHAPVTCLKEVKTNKTHPWSLNFGRVSFLPVHFCTQLFPQCPSPICVTQVLLNFEVPFLPRHDLLPVHRALILAWKTSKSTIRQISQDFISPQRVPCNSLILQNPLHSTLHVMWTQNIPESLLFCHLVCSFVLLRSTGVRLLWRHSIKKRRLSSSKLPLGHSCSNFTLKAR